jgi:hypothetical protein
MSRSPFKSFVYFASLQGPYYVVKLILLFLTLWIFDSTEFALLFQIQVLVGLVISLGFSGREINLINNSETEWLARLKSVSAEVGLMSLVGSALVALWLETSVWQVVLFCVTEVIVSALLIKNRIMKKSLQYTFMQGIRVLAPTSLVILIYFYLPDYKGQNAITIFSIGNILSIAFNIRALRELFDAQSFRMFSKHPDNNLIAPSMFSKIQGSSDVLATSLFWASDSKELFYFAVGARIASYILTFEGLLRAFFQRPVAEMIRASEYEAVRSLLTQIFILNLIVFILTGVATAIVSLLSVQSVDASYAPILIISVLSKTVIFLSLSSGLFLPLIGYSNRMMTLDIVAISLVLAYASIASDFLNFLFAVLLVNFFVAVGRLFLLLRGMK